MSVKAVFLGMATTDFVANVPHLPGRDEVFELNGLDVMGGGPAATAAVAFARLGGTAEFVGSVGADKVGSALRQELSQENVGTTLLLVDETGLAPRSVILVDAATGARSIMYSRGTARAPAFTDALRQAIETSDALHLDGFHVSVALEAAAHARSQGVPVSFDGGAGDRWPRLDELLPLVDWLVVARAFAERETGESDPVAAARSFSHDTVVITDGVNGAWYRMGAQEGFVPAFNVRVVDTTGAGDVFHGAFVHARLSGLDVRAAVRFASATAALKCQQPGGRAGIPTPDQVRQLLKEQAAP